MPLSSQGNRIDCPRCTRRFRTRPDLDRHLRNVHNLRHQLTLTVDHVTVGDESSLPADEHCWWVDFGDRVEQYYPLPDGGVPVETVDIDSDAAELVIIGEDETTIAAVDLPDVDTVDATALEWDTDRPDYIRLAFTR
jgi:hypothetical protein